MKDVHQKFGLSQCCYICMVPFQYQQHIKFVPTKQSFSVLRIVYVYNEHEHLPHPGNRNPIIFPFYSILFYIYTNRNYNNNTANFDCDNDNGGNVNYAIDDNNLIFSISMSCCQCTVVTEFLCTLQWRHNGRHGVSNHQPHHCLFNRLFRRR